MSKNVFLIETKIGHYSKTLIWRRWFPLQFGGVLVLSFEYYIQSIKAYHWSNKHSKCQIWSFRDIFKNLWRHLQSQYQYTFWELFVYRKRWMNSNYSEETQYCSRANVERRQYASYCQMIQLVMKRSGSTDVLGTTLGSGLEM